MRDFVLTLAFLFCLGWMILLFIRELGEMFEERPTADRANRLASGMLCSLLVEYAKEQSPDDLHLSFQWKAGVDAYTDWLKNPDMSGHVARRMLDKIRDQVSVQ